jgi:transcriptional regulator with XRE-family HTH domain
MEEGVPPTVQRRRLRVELRKAREAAGFTQKQVAEALDWSPSKLLRIENGRVGISTVDLKALLTHYSVKDKERVDEFVRMAQDSKRQTWSQYKDVLYQEFAIYLGFEGSAKLIRQVEQLFVPGLLQTEEYARAVIRAFAPADTSQAVMERQLEARLERQSLLDRKSPPEMFFILDEAVVRRWVANKPLDSGIMRHQLERLKELGSRSEISIQILPFALGTHFGMKGPFVILEFPEPEDDDLLFLESTRGNVVTRDNYDEIADYKNAFFDLEKLATSRTDLDEFLDGVIAEMSNQEKGASTPQRKRRSNVGGT